MGLKADQFDTLRLNWQASLIAKTTVAAWVRADGNGGSSFPRILAAPGYYLNFRFDGSANDNTLDFATTRTANGLTVDDEWLAPSGSIGTGA